MSVTPSNKFVISKLKRHTMKSLLSKGMRLDERRLTDVRKIEIVPGYVERAEGSALVKLGETMVLAGVKMDIVAPFPDTPNEGVLVVNAEFVPLASPTFEPGPPDENAIELARVVDRSLREVKAVALDKLVLEPGKHVWRVYVDIYVLNHDGNLYDASMLASMAALMSTGVPHAVKSENGYVVDRTSYSGLLGINRKVVTVTIAKIGSKLVVDPTYEEEQLADAALIVAVSDDGNIVGMQKVGPGSFSYEEVISAVELALDKGRVYIGALESAVQPYRDKLLKELNRQPQQPSISTSRGHIEVEGQPAIEAEETEEDSGEAGQG
ncbi:MAG: exosome complex protein Rrp42 [Thermoproteota archaeon]